MNCLAHNRWTSAWERLGAELPRPRAVLAISAHWYVERTRVTAMVRPRTIHDFGGFPAELFEVVYDAPGDPGVAARVAELLEPLAVELDLGGWGLDHGTWSVLSHLFPDASVPVVQLAIDATQPAEHHYELGRRLAPLRDEGVLILGSGDVVHNLRLARFSGLWPGGATGPEMPRGPEGGDRRGEAVYAWAARFDDMVRTWLEHHEHDRLVAYLGAGPAAQLSVPTPDHYLPLCYVAGAASDPADAVSVVTEGFDAASISMLSVQLG
jgi:4,5-DOPA dioxygenase extradiol